MSKVWEDSSRRDRGIIMKILNNPKEEYSYCGCEGEESIISDWGMKYCLIDIDGTCISKGNRGDHSSEAFLSTHLRCIRCGSIIVTLGEHPS